MVGDLTAFADTTPFRLPGVLDSANQLLSVGNVAKGDVIPTLRMLGDVAAGTGKPESLPQLASLYSTMAAQGKIQAQDIMQWTQRGIPLWGSLASVMGVAQSEMRGLVEKGQVGFPQLSAALASLTGEGGKWHGLTEKLGGTTGGMFSTLQDTFDGLTQKFASALLPAMNIKDGTGGL
ncbi:MAG TPA: tape measure protein, partial [Tepidisphaeraceae bacterium]|nr:tape measure protein [Tepidisphaeraceae bacterium]